MAAACGARPDEPPGASSDAVSEAIVTEPVRLVPRTRAVAEACASELSTTYCSQESAARGAARCAARLSAADLAACGGSGCTTTFTSAVASACREGRTYPDRASCERPVVEDCAFYRECLEAARPCGADGYALGFGERYCYTFLETDHRFSPEGQAWLRQIRPCLQRELVPALDGQIACDDVHASSFASHVTCYTREEHSMCDLPFGDVAVLAQLLWRELASLRALDEVKAVADRCAKRMFTGLLGAEEAGELEARRRFFSELAEASTDDARLRAWLDRELGSISAR